MQSVPESKPTDPNGGGGSTTDGNSLRDCRSQIHPCELLHGHQKGSGRVLLYEDPDELGVSGLTGAGRALFMANGTLSDKDWKLQDLSSVVIGCYQVPWPVPVQLSWSSGVHDDGSNQSSRVATIRNSAAAPTDATFATK